VHDSLSARVDLLLSDSGDTSVDLKRHQQIDRHLYRLCAKEINAYLEQGTQAWLTREQQKHLASKRNK
jgi:hypothetical protein